MRTATKSGHTHLDLCFCKLSTRGGLELLDRILNRGQIQKTNESTLLFVSYDRINYLATLCVSGTKHGKKKTQSNAGVYQTKNRCLRRMYYKS